MRWREGGRGRRERGEGGGEMRVIKKHIMYAKEMNKQAGAVKVIKVIREIPIKYSIPLHTHQPTRRLNNYVRSFNAP